MVVTFGFVLACARPQLISEQAGPNQPVQISIRHCFDSSIALPPKLGKKFLWEFFVSSNVSIIHHYYSKSIFLESSMSGPIYFKRFDKLSLKYFFSDFFNSPNWNYATFLTNFTVDIFKIYSKNHITIDSACSYYLYQSILYYIIHTASTKKIKSSKDIYTYIYWK